MSTWPVAALVRLTRVNLRSGPRPPWFLGVWLQARWVYSESVETQMTSTPSASKSGRALLKARISVGQTTGEDQHVVSSSVLPSPVRCSHVKSYVASRAWSVCLRRIMVNPHHRVEHQDHPTRV